MISRIAGIVGLMACLVSVFVLGGLRNLADFYGFGMVIGLTLSLGLLSVGGRAFTSGYLALKVLISKNPSRYRSAENTAILRNLATSLYSSSLVVSVVQFFQRPGGIDSKVLALVVFVLPVTIVELVVRPAIHRLRSSELACDTKDSAVKQNVGTTVFLVVGICVIAAIVACKATGFITTPDDMEHPAISETSVSPRTQIPQNTGAELLVLAANGTIAKGTILTTTNISVTAISYDDFSSDHVLSCKEGIESILSMEVCCSLSNGEPFLHSNLKRTMNGHALPVKP